MTTIAHLLVHRLVASVRAQENWPCAGPNAGEPARTAEANYVTHRDALVAYIEQLEKNQLPTSGEVPPCATI